MEFFLSITFFPFTKLEPRTLFNETKYSTAWIKDLLVKSWKVNQHYIDLSKTRFRFFKQNLKFKSYQLEKGIIEEKYFTKSGQQNFSTEIKCLFGLLFLDTQFKLIVCWEKHPNYIFWSKSTFGIFKWNTNTRLPCVWLIVWRASNG